MRVSLVYVIALVGRRITKFENIHSNRLVVVVIESLGKPVKINSSMGLIN
jgi:hypothetical protein